MHKALLYILFCGLILVYSNCKNANAYNSAALNSEPWNLVWSDEFDVDGLPSEDSWSYDEGDGCPRICGWGNNELQYYTAKDKNTARIENGHLLIEAHKKPMGSKEYSSARLVTKNKHSWLHGKIEVKARLPKGKGNWSAIWMLPENDVYGIWPRSGEIDIMEHVGYDPDTIVGTVHTEAFNHMIGTQKGKYQHLSDSESSFHVYGIEWTDEKIDWFVDGEKYHTFTNRHKTYKEWPYDKPFHLILNLAIGGNWGGKHGVEELVFPQTMEIDYVRVYQKEEKSE